MSGLGAIHNKGGKSTMKALYPWKDFNCLIGKDGFFPISPVTKDVEYNIPSLTKAIERKRMQIPKLEGLSMRIQEVEWNIHRYESYIAQLEGVPGSIPEAAGKEYVAWVESLRETEQ